MSGLTVRGLLSSSPVTELKGYLDGRREEAQVGGEGLSQGKTCFAGVSPFVSRLGLAVPS